MPRLLLALLLALVPSLALGQSVIDFEARTEGEIVGSLSMGNGITGDPLSGSVSLFGDSANPAITTNAALMFDATCTGGCTGGDNDLFKPELGNILIMAEDLVDSNSDGLIDDPDDADLMNAPFRFDFSGFGPGVVTVVSMSVLDVESVEAFGTVQLYSGGASGTLLTTLDLPVTGDNGLTTMNINVSGVDYMKVTLNGSGAIDNIAVAPDSVCGDGIVQTNTVCDPDADLPYDVRIAKGKKFRLSDAFLLEGVLPAEILQVTMDSPQHRFTELVNNTQFTVTQADCDHTGNRGTGRDRVFVTWRNADGSTDTDHLDIRYCDGDDDFVSQDPPVWSGCTAPEECDDGNSIDDDGCTNACTLPECGDGVVQAGEECDDGNTINDDACTNACTNPVCGDGIVQAGEACDDGNSNNGDGCTNDCTLPQCGDGVVQAGEECDDGNSVDDDGCTNACTTPVCGDGIVQAGEACDDGNSNNDDGCTNTCTLPTCGDGIVQSGEECDDGNTVNDDACSNACTTPRCGDGIIQSGESCDDGNTNNGDGCDEFCATETLCGNGVRDPDEECDGAGAGVCTSNICRSDCTCVQPIFRDPALIDLRKAPDFYKANGRVYPNELLQLTEVPVTLAIRLGGEIVWSQSIPAGGCLAARNGGSCTYRNKSAKFVGGIKLLKLRAKKDGRVGFKFQAYGDFGFADHGMELYVTIGEQSFGYTGDWVRLKDGEKWLLKFKPN